MIMIKKRFYFLRHGRTEWNEKELCQGHTDIPLNSAGREEAKSAAQRLHSEPITKIFTSPLLRARETATLIQDAFPKTELFEIEELKERHYGILEGGKSEVMYYLEEKEIEHPSIPKMYRVEEREAVRKRLISGINRCHKASENPLIVSHGRLFSILCEIMDVPPPEQLANTAIALCEPTSSGWNVKMI